MSAAAPKPRSQAGGRVGSHSSSSLSQVSCSALRGHGVEFQHVSSLLSEETAKNVSEDKKWRQRILSASCLSERAMMSLGVASRRPPRARERARKKSFGVVATWRQIDVGPEGRSRTSADATRRSPILTSPGGRRPPLLRSAPKGSHPSFSCALAAFN